jgi:maleate isomerase
MLIPKRLGILIPSSNTVVEEEAPKLIPNDIPVSLHFSRFRVTAISESPGSLAQFELDAMVAAASMLADAKVDLIAWTGTAASWLGFARDNALCKAVTDKTGISATSTVIAINSELRALGVRRIAFVTPYTAALEKAIVENYASIGMTTVAAERLDLTVNTEMAAVTVEKIAEMSRTSAKAAPEAIIVMCTNLRGATISASLTQELGIPVIDSVSATFRHCLMEMGLSSTSTGHMDSSSRQPG